MSGEGGGNVEGQVVDFHFPRIAGEDIGLKNPDKGVAGIGVDPGDAAHRPVPAVMVHGDVGLQAALQPDDGTQRTLFLDGHRIGVFGQRCPAMPAGAVQPADSAPVGRAFSDACPGIAARPVDRIIWIRMSRFRLGNLIILRMRERHGMEEAVSPAADPEPQGTGVHVEVMFCFYDTYGRGGRLRRTRFLDNFIHQCINRSCQIGSASAWKSTRTHFTDPSGQ